jgi:16S rRNA (cytosine1402-N4)-methyltransferase
MVDCTIGGGGHATVIADLLGEDGTLVGMDRDPDALRAAREALKSAPCRVVLIRANFRHLPQALADAGIGRVDGVLFDFGASSYQFDEVGRGFTYREDAPLDMRMDPESGPTAADLVNSLPVDVLAEIIREYGEEKWAARIAAFIAQERESRPISTTGDLVRVIKAAVPRGARRDGPHPARRTFQAFRIAVNDELKSIEQGLAGALAVTVPGGRVVAISYHSLEDRRVKETFRAAERPCVCPPEMPVCVCGRKPTAKVLTRKPVTPSAQEVLDNPRARSARLRAAMKVLGARKDE